MSRAFTQPLDVRQDSINGASERPRALRPNKLIDDRTVTADDLMRRMTIEETFNDKLQSIYDEVHRGAERRAAKRVSRAEASRGVWSGHGLRPGSIIRTRTSTRAFRTRRAGSASRPVARRACPKGFHRPSQAGPNLLERSRQERHGVGEGSVEWGVRRVRWPSAPSCAEGTPVRLSGQDCRAGHLQPEACGAGGRRDRQESTRPLNHDREKGRSGRVCVSTISNFDAQRSGGS